MLNVRDECDLPDDDGYDLFTRETEFERHAKHPRSSRPDQIQNQYVTRYSIQAQILRRGVNPRT
jgi:hypothetical protein